MLAAEVMSWQESVVRSLFFFLPNTSATAATVIAERIRNTISRTSLTTGKKHRIIVTISAGVVSTNDYYPTIPRTLYEEADKALYLAKKQGEKRVITSNESEKELYTKLETQA